MAEYALLIWLMSYLIYYLKKKGKNSVILANKEVIFYKFIYNLLCKWNSLNKPENMLDVWAAIPFNSLLTVDMRDPGLEPPSLVTISVDSGTRLSRLVVIGSPKACKFYH